MLRSTSSMRVGSDTHQYTGFGGECLPKEPLEIFKGKLSFSHSCLSPPTCSSSSAPKTTLLDLVHQVRISGQTASFVVLEGNVFLPDALIYQPALMYPHTLSWQICKLLQPIRFPKKVQLNASKSGITYLAQLTSGASSSKCSELTNYELTIRCLYRWCKVRLDSNVLWLSGRNFQVTRLKLKKQ